MIPMLRNAGSANLSCCAGLFARYFPCNSQCGHGSGTLAFEGCEAARLDPTEDVASRENAGDARAHGLIDEWPVSHPVHQHWPLR